MDAKAKKRALQILARLCELEISEIKEALEIEIPYNIWPKKKGNGKKRWIHAPCEELKKVQKAILKKILYRFKVNENLYGFVPGVAMKKGAEKHLGNISNYGWKVRIDLANCFPSVSAKALKKMFEDIFSEILIGQDEEVWQEFCDLVVFLTTHKGYLVQGSPTSPYLVNLILSWSGTIDDLEEFCRKEGFTFSVYADDFVVSSPGEEIPKLKIVKIIEKSGVFKTNPDKTRSNKAQHRCHRVTGISLSRSDLEKTPHLTLSTKKQKHYRGKIYRALSFLRKGLIPSIERDGFSLEQITGYVSWTKHICGKDIPSSLKYLIEEFETRTKKIKAEG